MSFWSTQTLRKRLPGIINKFSNENMGNASYDLTLGKEVYISSLPDAKPEDRKKIILEENGEAVIPPGQFAFLITEEYVSIPEDSIALINFKFNKKASGLINVSGFHVDPGYKGKIIFATYNSGGSFFKVQRGEPIFTIWFASLDDKDENPRKGTGYYTIPTKLTNQPDLSSSLPHLNERIKNLEKKVDRFSIRQGIIWGVLVSAIIFGSKIVYDQYTKNDNQAVISKQKN